MELPKMLYCIYFSRILTDLWLPIQEKHRQYQFSIVPYEDTKEHPLAKKKELTLCDLHGERLITIKSGDTEPIDHFHDMMKMTHLQILMKEADYYYDMETFNTCEQMGVLLLTLDAWADIHPFLTTLLPVSWDYKVPYGILYAKNPSEDVAEFIKIIKQQFVNNIRLHK